MKNQINVNLWWLIVNYIHRGDSPFCGLYYMCNGMKFLYLLKSIICFFVVRHFILWKGKRYEIFSWVQKKKNGGRTFVRSPSSYNFIFCITEWHTRNGVHQLIEMTQSIASHSLRVFERHYTTVICIRILGWKSQNTLYVKVLSFALSFLCKLR